MTQVSFIFKTMTVSKFLYLKMIVVLNQIDLRDRIELIQDFDMPIVSNSVQMSPDGQYIFATGNQTYSSMLSLLICFNVYILKRNL